MTRQVQDVLVLMGLDEDVDPDDPTTKQALERLEDMLEAMKGVDAGAVDGPSVSWDYMQKLEQDLRSSIED